ncbi:MarR family winged helix-turn-helix transcriptional regulator [Winogradskya humida]|uniref:HTH marR-type domain-containing protein n=1 Tax=Winogradskya humida TaxID=113566 RepID=A0ABQ3ZXX9_9ACTN|nr:helix-turn-helix domain-containing protein [Actinoplanes humidus]GIE23443.1 hypothetical protein Ahu01nite_065450 [Actinoplanes humidus]
MGGEEWIREGDLTFEQAQVIGYLEQKPGAIQRDIAEMTRTTAANISLLLKVLERRGLVERRTGGGNERSKRLAAAEAVTSVYQVINAGFIGSVHDTSLLAAVRFGTPLFGLVFAIAGADDTAVQIPGTLMMGVTAGVLPLFAYTFGKGDRRRPAGLRRHGRRRRRGLRSPDCSSSVTRCSRCSPPTGRP